MAKLSQQVQRGRVSRTQRVLQQQEEAKEKKKFLELKQKASQVREDRFANVSTVDDYRQEYRDLSSDIQPFFATPEEVQAGKEQDIKQTKEKVSERISVVKDKITQAEQRKNERLKKAQEIYLRKKRSTGNKEKRERYQQQYKDKVSDIKDDYEEYETGYDAQIKALNQGISQLSRGKNLSYSDIEKYSREYGGYQKIRQEQRNEFVQAPAMVESREISPERLEQLKADALAKQRENIMFNKRLEWEESDKQRSAQNLLFGNLPQKQSPLFTNLPKLKPKQKQFDFEKSVLTAKDLPIGYGGQQSISTQPRTLELSQEQLKNIETMPDPLSKEGISKGAKFGFSVASAPVKFLSQRVQFGEGDTFLKRLQFVYGKDKPRTKPTLLVNQASRFVEGKQKDITRKGIGEKKVEGFEESLKEVYQPIYQTEFEKEYFEDILYERITPEKAQEEFSKGKTANVLGEAYTQDYLKGFEKLQKGQPMLSKWGTGFKLLGTDVQKLSLSFVKSPTNVAFGTTAVVGASSVLKAIPPKISTGINVVAFPYGTYKAFSPTSTPRESASGLLIAGTSLGVIGYGSYKKFKTPIATTKPIKVPKISAKAKNLLFKTDKSLGIERTIYPKQKLAQTVTQGRRTLVTTEGRILKASFWKQFGVTTPAKDLYVYRGLPSDKIRPIITSGRGLGSVSYRGASNYQKALKLINKYGVNYRIGSQVTYIKPTTGQAKNLLRTVKPKVIDTTTQGVIYPKDDIGVGRFQFEVTPRVIDVNKNLGLKTLGGKTKVYQTDFVRIKGADVDKYSNVVEYGYTKKVLSFKPFKGYQPKLEVLGKGYTKSSMVRVNPRELIRGGGIKYKELVTDTSVKMSSGFKQVRGKLQKDLFFNFKKQVAIGDFKGIDINKFQAPANIKKTPFTKTFTPEKANKVLKEILKGKLNKKSIGALSDTFSSRGPRPDLITSPYAGTGQYEQSAGFIYRSTKTGVSDVLKTPVSPPDIATPRSIGKFIQINRLSTGTVAQGFYLAPQLKTNTKNMFSLKEQLKLRTEFDFENITKIKQNLNLRQGTALKQGSQLKTGTSAVLKNVVDVSPAVKSIIDSPIIRQPKISVPKTPKFGGGFYLPLNRREKLKSSIKKKSLYELAYLPDFTSRAIGLAPEQLTQEQAKKRLKKIMTGLEVRKGVRLK